MRRSRLLVSVRTVVEAETVLSTSADLIDIKEPSHGSLGMAAESTICAIRDVIDCRRLISAAMGELADSAPVEPWLRGVQYLKWGMAGCSRAIDWRKLFLKRAGECLEIGAAPVLVGYADAARAGSPSAETLLKFLTEQSSPILLIDTWKKDRPLSEWVAFNQISELVTECKEKGVEVALAGSLSGNQIQTFSARGIIPDWVGVRGAVCKGKDRTGALMPEKIHELMAILPGESPINAESLSDPHS